MSFDEASLAQIRAADPQMSTWLSANAGSGKTRVLTNRVARLLLRNVPPERILCLTYTRAAASEMQNRLFETLGTWSMLPDAELRAALHDLGLQSSENTPDLRHRARTLFARAIDTPGGLKIQTIHAFCGAILRRFPLEAGVSPAFTELDTLAAKRLREDVLNALATGPQGNVFEALALHVTSDQALDSLLDAMLRHRDGLTDQADVQRRLEQALELPQGFSPDDWPALTGVGAGDPWLAQAAETLQAASQKTVQSYGALLQKLEESGWSTELREELFNASLMGSSGDKLPVAKLSFPPKKFVEEAPDLTEELHDFMQRLAQTRAAMLAHTAFTRSAALHDFAALYLHALERAKTRRAQLDFDDLITKVRNLLQAPGVAEWVLFRLDGGIDHILVDEAQDTSPRQWDIVRLLAEEFAAGKGAREDVERTIFVVGDPKQSIYSFQGADPSGFDRMREHFDASLTRAGAPFTTGELLYSFRSSRAVLQAVDQTFEAIPKDAFDAPCTHSAFFNDMPGRVDVWPNLPAPENEEAKPFSVPLDAPSANDPELVLADRVVRFIAETLKAGTRITTNKGETKRLTPGDFLILVQRRSPIFHEIIRACKLHGVPVAGADRMRKGSMLASKDLMALLRFAVTPEDDLSLAIVLRSPLLGWSEGQLYDLAQPRGKAYLWEALRKARDAHPTTFALLDDIRANADFLRPFELLSRILVNHDGRRKLLSRLGPEAEDGIDALLAQALTYEQTEVPSTTGFLGWYDADDSDLKRALDGTDAVRVMTVHGAKGLEAPVVILPDARLQKLSPRGALLDMPDGLTVWPNGKGKATEDIDALRADKEAADQAERLRLLYVAMTRARNWLIVTAAKDASNPDSDKLSWLDHVRTGLEQLGAVPFETPNGPGLRWAVGDWPADLPSKGETQDTQDTLPVLPDWVTTRLPRIPPLPGPLSPSNLGGAKVLFGQSDAPLLDEEAAKARGTALHWMLEHLPSTPPDHWAAMAELAPNIDTDTLRAEILAEATRVLTAPDLAPLFQHPDALREVPVTARLLQAPNRPLFGTIDLMIPAPDHILVIDFKSNAVVPDTPEQVPDGLLRQMGAYAEALTLIYPTRRIDAAILWTARAKLMPLPGALVRTAFVQTPFDGPTP